MKQCLLKAMLIALLVTIAAFAWGQSIFWQDTFDANNGWTVEPNWSVTGGQLVLNWSPEAENYNMSAISPNLTIPAGAGDLVISQYIDEYAGQGTTVPETFEISVVIGGTPTVIWTYSTDADWGVTGGQDLILPLAAYSGQTIQLKFRSFGDSTFNFDYWRVYGITAYANLDADMAALTITGSTTPTQGTETNYVVTVKNNGTTAAAAYTVKLMKNGTVEAGSQAGTNLAPNATQVYTFNWTPDAPGAAALTGKVILAGDQNPNNDITAPLNIVIQPTGVSAVTIGDGSSSGRVPVDMYYKNSLYENIYYQDELGIASGSFSSVAFYNNFTTNLPAKPIKIWLGTTTNNDLSAGWIPSTQLTLVFDGVVDFPIGPNTITIPFTTPYNYPGGNLVMMVNRPMDTAYFASTDVFLAQTIGTNRSRNIYNDTTVYDPAAPPATSTLSGLFPKTTFFYTGTAVTTDLGVVSLTGNTTPSVGTVWNYNVSIRNNGSVAQNTYQVKLYKEGNVELSSVAGTTIAPLQTLQFSLPWTPATAGATFIYAKVFLAGDQIAVNDQSPNYPVVVQEAGVVAVTVGTGGSVGKYPLDMFYKASLSETVYLASELNIGGLLTGIQYYNNFVTDLPNKPTKIWAGETQLENLSTGWIPSTALTLVYDGTVNYPLGQNNITIPFTTPLPYGGGNLAIMVERPLDAAYFSSSDNFVTQTVGTNRTRKVQSDTIVYDPAAPPTATPTGIFPKTTFFFITEGMGALNGTVTVNGTPLAGARVTVANSNLSYTTGANGTYSFPYITEGLQVVSATKHGYNVVTHNVTIVEDQTTTQDFAVSLLPQVTITGRIVGSDQPTIGLPGTIALSGYENYNATADASGNFTLTNVYANQTYSYLVGALGYANTTGQVVVGSVDVNLGDVVVNEIANPVNTVVATEAANFSNVVVTWNEPGQGGGEWIHYDSGENDDSIGTGGAADFDVAIRYPASALADYAGMSLYSLKVWPAQAGTFALRVWTGGTATAPATMVVDQPFTPTLDTYNTVMLNTPVLITGNQELWFGYRCNVTTGFPAGVDAGPATNGFGNMIYWQGAWTTLTALSADLNYNWNIQGYVGYDAPTRGAKLTPLAFNSNRINSGTLTTSGIENKKNVNVVSRSESKDRVRVGYKVWRLLSADQANETAWTSLTPNYITELTYTDNAWQPLPSGVYKFAVKAVYTNDVMSNPAFSNEIHKGMMGVLSGTVTDFGNGSPVAGAVVRAGTYSGTSDAQGAYSFGVYQGSYTVTCTKPGFLPYSQANVSITGLQTTTVNIALTEIPYPPNNVVATETTDFQLVNLTWAAPDPNTAPVEDFESGNLTAFPWVTGGDAPWFVTDTDAHAGTNSATNGDITHNQASNLEITRNVLVAGNISFWYKVSSESNYDFLKFYINGAEMGSWSGTVAWTQATYPVALGNNTFKWVYSKDVSDDAGSDCAWIDDVTFPVSSDPVRITLNRTNPNEAQKATKAQNQDNETDATTRAFVGYRVWRLLAADQANENAWTSLTPSSITPTQFTDNTWQPLPSGVYKFAVKAVYSNDVFSLPAFSNEVHKGMMGVLTGEVTEFGTNLPVAGATVTAGTYSGITNTSGVYSFGVYAGTYNVVAAKPGYQPASQAGVVIVGMQTTNQNFVLTELTLPPTAVQAALAGNNVNITWSAPGGGGTGFTEDFESYPNFAISFAPWTLVDVDLSTTYGMTGTTWTNAYAAQAYIIFNPSATTPALTTVATHGGAKMAACFAALLPAQGGTGPNNDWLISPQVTVMPGDVVNFWARSHTAEYGLERFKVGVSTTGTAPANFTIISGANYVSAPIDWTNYNYSLSAYAGQQVYVGIQCISNDAFIFFVDDFLIGAPPARDEFIAQTNDQEVLTKMNIYTQGIGQLKANEMKYYKPSTGVVSILPSIDLSSLVTIDETRALTGYKVWRLISGQETNETGWTSLTANPISATAYQDTGWGALPDGTYKWAVKAVYTGGALSIPALSNPLTKMTQIGTIAGIVRNQQNQAIAGATVTSGTYTATTNTNGAYSIIVPAGTHSVTASHANYAPSTQTGIIVLTGQTTTVNFILAPTQNLLVDGFETYANFALTFAPWTLVDVDLSVTYGIENVTFQNSGAAMAYIIFNPSATTPAVTTSVPHGGAKMAASFAAILPAQGGTGPNNDWLITPQVTGAAQIKFWAKSHTAQYGLERFKVGVSTTGTAPANFTIISGANYISAPIDWTEYTYNLAYGNTPIRIGIQCISNDAFIFFVDDVLITGGGTANEDITVPVVATELKTNYPNPFNPETTIAFNMKETSEVSIEIYNVKGQLVKTLLNDVKDAGSHSVIWNGKDNNGRAVSSGIYYYKMNTGKYSSTKKMIMMK